jgi:hypothetical protein
MKMGIGIGWPNATYQSGSAALTAEILPSVDFDIPSDSNYTIEFWAGYVDSGGPSFPQTFFSFGPGYTTHTAFLSRGGSNWDFIYLIGGVPLFIVDVTTEMNSSVWNYFVVQRKGSQTAFAINGVWKGYYSSGSPAISSDGLPMYIGSRNTGDTLNGMMNNFRWSTVAIYDDAVNFSPPFSDLPIEASSLLLVMQGFDLPGSLADQTGNGHDMIKGTDCSYSPFNVFGDPGSAGSLYFI